jgi:hypothetical protein
MKKKKELRKLSNCNVLRNEKEANSVCPNCKHCSLIIRVHSTYANILKNIYKKVRKIVGIG